MREIKFRAIHKASGKMVYGNLILANRSGYPKSFAQIEQSEYNDYANWEVDEATVGQYTGLKDKNGVDVYEGDLLQNESEEGDDDIAICVVEYYPAKFVRRYVEHNPQWDGIVIDGLTQADLNFLGWHVVGNIYENPELLAGGE